MAQKAKQAGDHIDARCTRCRAVTNHTIIAMVGDRAARVRCNTCGGDHNYRPPQTARATGPAAEKVKPARRTGSDRRRTSQEEQWQQAAGQADPGLAIRYDMARGYRLDDLVDHPVFGIGVVKALFKPNKMEVLFASGLKALRCKL